MKAGRSPKKQLEQLKQRQENLTGWSCKSFICEWSQTNNVANNSSKEMTGPQPPHPTQFFNPALPDIAFTLFSFHLGLCSLTLNKSFSHTCLALSFVEKRRAKTESQAAPALCVRLWGHPSFWIIQPVAQSCDLQKVMPLCHKFYQKTPLIQTTPQTCVCSRR